MAPGLPYAIAAQAAYPDRQVVAFVGDGGFTMLMGDFATGLKSFRKGLSEGEKAEDEPKVDPVKTIDHQPPPTVGAAMGSGTPATAGAPSDTRETG